MTRSPDQYRTADFDYRLPDDRIARVPTERRDESRALILNRGSAALGHRTFHEIVDLIPPGDVLVLNETRVFPARLLGTRDGGGPAEVLLLRLVGADPGTWEALVRPGARLKPGRMVEVGSDLRIEILESRADGSRIVQLHSSLEPRAAIARYGHMPLPPYIDRADDAIDRERYQTVFARAEGSVAAPTAGLHFTTELLERLRNNGVRSATLVLHVGVGTFRPVEVEDPAEHIMHDEEYEVGDESALLLNHVRASGGAIWAVGTTVARTLESIVSPEGTFAPARGSTRLFIRPGYQFRAVDHLITNFHLPRSTLLMLVAAFAGYERVMAAYQTAIEEGYRFYSYGDAMVII